MKPTSTSEATPVFDSMLLDDRWLEVHTFPWLLPEWEPWDLYAPSLREMAVQLSGRDDYTTWTMEQAYELVAKLRSEDPVDAVTSAGSDAD